MIASTRKGRPASAATDPEPASKAAAGNKTSSHEKLTPSAEERARSDFVARLSLAVLILAARFFIALFDSCGVSSLYLNLKLLLLLQMAKCCRNSWCLCFVADSDNLVIPGA